MTELDDHADERLALVEQRITDLDLRVAGLAHANVELARQLSELAMASRAQTHAHTGPEAP